MKFRLNTAVLFILSQFLIIIVSLILIIFNIIDIKLAIIFSQFLTNLCIFGFLIYAIFFHSAKRWPNLKWYDRLIKILTFGSR